MSTRELRRVEVLGRVKAGAVALTDAATLLGLSYRQVKRVWRRFKRGGPRALGHRAAGRRSNHRRPSALRRRVLALIREKYGGEVTTRFGPTLAAEHLASEDGIAIDHETLRRWMLAAGVWSRQRRRTPYRQRRDRKAHFGELVQLDGSFHAWYEARGPQRCLLTMVDDATSLTAGRVNAEETIWAAVDVLRQWIEQYGVPLALYTDWKNVYVRLPNAEERATGTPALTQFGRMCAALAIQIIPASSPQAKGRIERNHGTHQDRLVKKLRRLGIADDVTANQFLKTTYWPAHNARFSHPAAAGEDFHRRGPSATTLDRIFRLETTRTVGHDWVVRYHNRYFQLRRAHRYVPACSTVTIGEGRDGRVTIEYRGRRQVWTELSGPPVHPPPRGPVASPPAPVKVRPPSADHPWRRSYKSMLTKAPSPSAGTELKGTFLSS